MRKRIYLIIIWTITLCVILYAGYNGTRKFRNRDSFTSLHIKNGNTIEQEVPAFNSLNIDARVMGIRIHRGSGYSVYCNFTNPNLEPEIEYSNSTLKIRQRGGKAEGNSSKCEMDITVPGNADLKEIIAELNVGALEIKGISVDTAKLRTNVGAIEIRDFDFNTIELESNVGAVELELDGRQSDYNWNLSTSLGAISLFNRDIHRSYRENNHASKSITARTNIGAIEIR